MQFRESERINIEPLTWKPWNGESREYWEEDGAIQWRGRKESMGGERNQILKNWLILEWKGKRNFSGLNKPIFNCPANGWPDHTYFILIFYVLLFMLLPVFQFSPFTPLCPSHSPLPQSIPTPFPRVLHVRFWQILSPSFKLSNILFLIFKIY